MPALTFVAPIIRAAIASLQAGIEAQIAVFNAEAANTVTLVAPVEYVFGAADPLILLAGPVVEVAATQGGSGEFDLGRNAFDHDPRVTVCVWHEGERADLAKTYEMSLGLGRCVIETLMADGAFGAEVEISQEGGIEWRADVLPSDPTDDQREFRKWRVPFLVSFRLEAVERLQ